MGGAVVGGNDDVDAAVVVDVADGQAAAEPRLPEDCAGVGGHVYEAVAGVTDQKHWLAIVKIGIVDLHSIEIVALGNDEIFPAVIVIIEEASAPAGVKHGDAAQTRTEAGVGETSVATVLVQGVALVSQVGDKEVGPAIIIIVGEIDAHAGEGATVAIDGDLRHEADFFKGAVALIVIEELDHGVVGDEKVDLSVAVVIGDRDTQALAGLGYPDFVRDFVEV